jgi:hypothetical protein
MRFQHTVRTFSTIIGLFSLISCGGSAVKQVTPSPTPVTAQSVLDQASQQFESVNSLHFELQVDGSVPLDQNGTIKLHSASGDLKRPNSAKAKAKVTFLGANLSIDMVSVGSDQYITNPVSGKWEKAPSDLGYDPAVLFDDNQGIAHVLKNVQSPTIAGSDNVDSKDAYHIKGTVRKQDVQPIAGGAINSDTVPVDIWVDKQTHDVLKLVLHDTGASGGNSENTWTLLLTKQNEDVTIDKPNL